MCAEPTFGKRNALSPVTDENSLLATQCKNADAARLYERCQAIQEKVLAPEHPDLAATLHDRAGLLRTQVGIEGWFWACGSV